VDFGRFRRDSPPKRAELVNLLQILKEAARQVKGFPQAGGIDNPVEPQQDCRPRLARL